MSIKVIVTTYCPEPGHPRGEYLKPVVNSLAKNLKTLEAFTIIQANDGPIDDPHLIKVADTGLHLARSGGERGGIGKSLNRALESVDDLWLYTTDDWLLTSEYDLDQAHKLVRRCGYEYVRLGPPHPNIDATIKFQQNVGWWLELHQESKGFVFATRPFLATRAFYDAVGPFKEQCDSYVCERDYSDRVYACALKHTRWMAEVVSGSFEGPWEHIGEVNVGETYP